MCRLFAFSFCDKTTKESRVRYVNLFKALSLHGAVLPSSVPGHMDGWGISAYYNHTVQPECYKSTSPAHLDIFFNENSFFSNRTFVSGVAHIRKKTVGDTLLVNTHPFVSSQYSFIHNGNIDSIDFYSGLSKDCDGQTDSERLFKRFLEIKNQEGLSSENAFIAMLEEIKKLYPMYSAINAILHDGEHMFVSRIVNESSLCYSATELLEYFTLYVGRTKEGSVIISSEKIPDSDISYYLLPNDSVSTVNLSRGEVATQLLF